MKIASLVKAFRVDENRVKVLYFHNERSQEFLVEWNNIHPETGEVGEYDLKLDCLSNSERLNEIINNAIAKGESDDNPDLNLYFDLRDSFSYSDCNDLD